MATLEVTCRYCPQTKSVRKHDTGATKAQRYRCLDCCKLNTVPIVVQSFNELMLIHSSLIKILPVTKIQIIS